MTARLFNVWAILAISAALCPELARGDGEEFRANLAKWNRPAGSGPARATPAAHWQEQPGDPPAPLPENAPGPLPPQAAPPGRAVEYAHGSVDGWVGEAYPGEPWLQGDPGCNSCGNGWCGDCCGGPFQRGPAYGYGDPCQACRPPLWWLRAELLLWWRQGRGYPPLVTTDPAAEAIDTAGILPDATILYDGSGQTTQMQAGLRLDFGTWIDPCETFGMGGRLWVLGTDSGEFARSSVDNAVLAVPFFDIDNGVNDALLVSHPDAVDGRSGRIDISGNNEVFGADLYGRVLYARTCRGRVDLVGGYHVSRINEYFQMASTITVIGNGGLDPTGRVLRVVDRFDTRNEFHGGTIGLMSEHDWCGLSLRTGLKVALGNMRQRVLISGNTTITDPGDVPTVTAGGLFTAASNIGQYERNEFAATPEANLTIGYRIRPNLECTLGYSFVYWSNVVRPGSLIDTTIDTDGNNVERPAFNFRTSDFWVQGLSLGVNWEF